MNTTNLHGTTNEIPSSQPHQPKAGDKEMVAGGRCRATSNKLPASAPRPFIIPIFIPHAGCPHQCVFCNQVSISGVKQKRITPDELRAQIQGFLRYKKKKRKPVQVAFFGGNFLGLKEKEITLLLETAAEYVRDGRVDGIRFSTRPDTIDERTLEIIRNRPVSTVELGVQSMNDQVLTLAGRGHSASDTVRAVERLKERHFSIGLQMMVGLPGDDETGSLATAQRIIDLGPEFVRIYPTVVVANSRLAGWYKKGDYTPLSLVKAVTLVKKIYREFKNAGIGVIRMGLQASEDLEEGTTVLAGPHHPAFGHLVHSEIFLDMAVSAIESAAPLKNSLTIAVNPRSISKMRGLNNSNIKKLQNRFQLTSLVVNPDASLAVEELKLG
jgi:histone acetyltransferase (RNA polymerase elongator complex component)